MPGGLPARRHRASAIFAAAVSALVVPWLVWPPRRVSAWIGRTGGRIVGLALRTERRASLINLRRAYGPSMTEPEARRLTGRVFANFGQSLVEGIRLAWHMRKGRTAGAVEWTVESPELAQRILNDPRPKIFVTGHLGSWEVAPMIAAHAQGGRGAAVARQFGVRALELVSRALRFPPAFGIIPRRGGAAEALRRLRAGEHIALLFDEDEGRRGVFVDFFGRQASTTRLPALLSVMTGSPIVLGAAVRESSRHRKRPGLTFKLAVFEPPAGPDLSANVRSLTEAFTARFEQWVRQAPAQWNWAQWRWRTRPDGTRETYRRSDVSAAFRNGAVE